MCRVTARLTAMFRRDAATRPSLPPRIPSAPSIIRAALRRRLRIVRHRALRWFGEPIAVVERKRREDTVDFAWVYAFRPRTARHYVRLERATKHVA